MKAPIGVILAGGLATRMGGGDKGLLDLGGQSVLARVIERLTPQVSELVLNANGDASRFSEIGLPVVPDTIEGFAGPLAGVLAGMDWAGERGADTIVTAAADTPFFPRDLVRRFQQDTRDMRHPLTLAATPDPKRGTARQPTFGLWPVALRHDLRAALTEGLRKVVLWTEMHDGRETVFDNTDANPFFNINTPDDLARAHGLLERVT